MRGPAIRALLLAAALSLLGASSAQAFIYWATDGLGDSGTTIGRANNDGSGPNPSFVTGANGATGVAVNATHLYWTNVTTGILSRANLDGTSPERNLITGGNTP